MLLNDFFEIVKQEISTGIVNARISLNKDHGIFNGHFPGQPVVPGVCMLQIVKEILELQMDARLQIREADNIKFISILDPNRHGMVDLKISCLEDGKALQVTASMFSGEITFFKLKAAFQRI